MADMFIRSETVSGIAKTIRKITNTESKINLGRFAGGDYEEKYYEGEGIVSGEPTDDIPDGYILPSGTIEISANTEEGQLLDVSQYASAKVNVPIPEGYLLPSGTLEITGNGEGIDVSEYAFVNIKVPTIVSPTPIEVSTEAEMTALLSSAEVGSIYKYIGTSGTYENGGLYLVEEVAEGEPTTDLTNTSWELNDNLAGFPQQEVWFNVNFTCNGSNYNGIILEPEGKLSYITDVVLLVYDSGWLQYPSLPDAAFKSITIIGGDDVRNPALAEWLDDNIIIPTVEGSN